MTEPQEKTNNALLILFAVMALIILLDIVLTGSVHTAKVETVRKTLQKQYNAAANHHFSYGIDTKNFYFPVSEHFANNVEKGQTVKFKVSPIFNKVNSYESLESGEKGTYSLRLVSGLIIPVLAILFLGVHFKFRKLGALALIIRILLLFDLVYLLL